MEVYHVPEWKDIIKRCCFSSLILKFIAIQKNFLTKLENPKFLCNIYILKKWRGLPWWSNG